MNKFSILISEASIPEFNTRAYGEKLPGNIIAIEHDIIGGKHLYNFHLKYNAPLSKPNSNAVFNISNLADLKFDEYAAVIDGITTKTIFLRKDTFDFILELISWPSISLLTSTNAEFGAVQRYVCDNYKSNLYAVRYIRGGIENKKYEVFSTTDNEFFFSSKDILDDVKDFITNYRNVKKAGRKSDKDSLKNFFGEHVKINSGNSSGIYIIISKSGNNKLTVSLDEDDNIIIERVSIGEKIDNNTMGIIKKLMEF